MVPKVSLQDFLPILDAPRPKITNWSFWPSCEVLLTSVWPKSGFGPFEVSLRIKFLKFWPGETSNLYGNGPKSFPKGFLPILAAPLLKITNRSFWLPCDQMVLLTSVWLNPGFGPFEVVPSVKFSKFWLGETLDLYVNGAESFPPRIFTYFRRPTAKNCESVFFIVVRPYDAFDGCVKKIRVRSF